MISKIKTGSTFSGVLAYNSKGELLDKNVLSDSLRGQLQELSAVASMNTRAEKKVKHIILSFAESDKEKLTDSKLTAIARDYLDRMGYSKNQYLAYKHTDTDHAHMHIVVNRIRLDNQLATKDSQENYRSRDAAMWIEKKYNLEQTPKYSKTKATKKNTQFAKYKKSKGEITDRDVLEAHCNNILNQHKVTDREDFSLWLENNIDAKLIETKSGKGYLFEYRGRTYKASEVNRKFSYGNLQKLFAENRGEKIKKEIKKEIRRDPEPPKQQKTISQQPRRNKSRDKGMSI